ncbi:MAG: hypothetical protein QXV69_06630 [Sulfolobaceae archaeon]
MRYMTVNMPKDYSYSLDVVTSEVYYSSTNFKTTITQILTSIDDTTAKRILGEYLKVDDIKHLVDVKKLAALILWLKYVVELKVDDISLFEDPPFIEIDIDECDWEEWDIIAKSVKRELLSEGLEDIAERVAIVCPRALRG